MTDKQKKSRRRFMADVLFLGGGLTAAALLAKTKLMDSGLGNPPVTAGVMCPPEDLHPTPQATPTPEDCAPMPGELMPAQPPEDLKNAEGNFIIPEADPTPKENP